MEPVFWHARPAKLFDCLRKTYHVKAWIDFSVSDGQLACACARERIPYAGICLTEDHMQRVRSRCIQQLVESSFTEGSGDRMHVISICCHPNELQDFHNFRLCLLVHGWVGRVGSALLVRMGLLGFGLVGDYIAIRVICQDLYDPKLAIAMKTTTSKQTPQQADKAKAAGATSGGAGGNSSSTSAAPGNPPGSTASTSTTATKTGQATASQSLALFKEKLAKLQEQGASTQQG